VNWAKLIAALMVTVAVSAGVAQAQTKITAYGYPGDLTPDSNSSNGIGNHDNKLTPFQGAGGVSDAALTAAAAQQYGVSIGQTFTVTGANGSTYTLRYEDTAPESDSRIDIYDSNQLLTGGNDNNFSTSATAFNDGPVVNSDSNPVGGTTAGSNPVGGTTAQSGTSTNTMNNQTPFEQVFGSMQQFLNQPAPKAVSLIGTILAFVCLLWSIANSFYASYDEDWRPKVMAFIKAIVIVAFIANSGQLINGIEQGVDQAYQANGAGGAGIPKVLDDIRDNNPAANQYRTQPAPWPTDMWGNMKAAINDFCYALGRGLTMAIWAAVWIFRFLQDVFIVTLYIILPLAFGLAVTPFFSNVGTSVISSLVGVLLWPVGFLIVDTFVLKILQAVLQGLNAWGSAAPGGEGLNAVFWFLTASNPIGFGLALLLIGIVVLLMTVLGYYASVKIITTLFGAAGGLISSGIGALGAAASAAAGLTAGAAALGVGAAAYGGGSALLGASNALSATGGGREALTGPGGGREALTGPNEVTGAALSSPRSSVLGEGTGSAQPLTSDNGEVNGVVDGVSGAIGGQNSSQSPSRLPQSASSTGGTVDGVVDGVASAVGGARNARARGLGSARSSNPGSSEFRGSSSDLRQGGLSSADMRTSGASAGFGGNESFAPGSESGQLGDNAQEPNNVGSDAGGGDSAQRPPPRRSISRLRTAGSIMQRAGLVMMAGSFSRTMRQTMKNTAAHAVVDGSLRYNPTPRRRSLDELDDMRQPES
jgi:hypothetical protein